MYVVLAKNMFHFKCKWYVILSSMSNANNVYEHELMDIEKTILCSELVC